MTWRVLLALALLLSACLPARADVAVAAPLDLNKLRLPPGFRIALFARLPSAPRFLAFAPNGTLFVSLSGAGQIAAINSLGQVSIFARGLQEPHGLAFLGADLYAAEESRVRVYRNLDPARTQVLVSNLPTGGHFTRTVGFGPDGKMYVSIGSSCNLCVEPDPRRAAIVRYNPDGTGEEIFARGLRNSVGFRWHPQTRELWATDNGFDELADDLPPEEINIVRQGGDYGWPYCYADRVPNPLFRPPDPSRCAATVPAALQMQAHSAPLGLDFYTGTQFPAPYRGDAFVAFHGSWNRTVPTGYKIVRIRAMDGVPGALEDFLTGWLDGNTSSGRPTDVLTGPDGALYISDDRANVIYRVTYAGALLNPGGVTNAASYSASTAAAPGGLISIFGRNLFSGVFQAAALPLPAAIEGLAVTINGRPAPLLFANATQINAQAPPGITGPATLTLTTANGSDSAGITMAEAAPGLFSQDASGSGPGAIRKTGDVLEIYATGLGATTEEVAAGAGAPAGRPVSTRALPTVTVGGRPAEVLFSGLAPGFAGLYQVNVRVPSGVSGIAVPVTLTMAGQTSNTVTVAIQ